MDMLSKIPASDRADFLLCMSHTNIVSKLKEKIVGSINFTQERFQGLSQQQLSVILKNTRSIELSNGCSI